MDELLILYTPVLLEPCERLGAAGQGAVVDVVNVGEDGYSLARSEFGNVVQSVI